MTIYLCGFMGCGKTTAGRALADMMSLEYTDMDAYIEKKAGMSIPQIFAEKGEDSFRRMETEAVAELGKAGGIIACGGGAMLKEINAKTAAEYGTVVYIDVPYDACYDRISGDTNRPIVMANTKESLEEIYNDRVPLYIAHSQIKADGTGSPEAIAARIRDAVKEHLNIQKG
ncbi:MAG: shikimate kinase [Oscillospiraceae bacterium]|nr:shikimate kinase [Oscillospiraceae bacterium]